MDAFRCWSLAAVWCIAGVAAGQQVVVVADGENPPVERSAYVADLFDVVRTLRWDGTMEGLCDGFEFRGFSPLVDPSQNGAQRRVRFADWGDLDVGGAAGGVVVEGVAVLVRTFFTDGDTNNVAEGVDVSLRLLDADNGFNFFPGPRSPVPGRPATDRLSGEPLGAGEIRWRDIPEDISPDNSGTLLLLIAEFDIDPADGSPVTTVTFASGGEVDLDPPGLEGAGLHDFGYEVSVEFDGGLPADPPLIEVALVRQSEVNPLVDPIVFPQPLSPGAEDFFDLFDAAQPFPGGYIGTFTFGGLACEGHGDAANTPFAQAYLALGLVEAPCSLADQQRPFGQLGFSDVAEFIAAFNRGDILRPRFDNTGYADFNGDGLINFADVSRFIFAFNEGCTVVPL